MQQHRLPTQQFKSPPWYRLPSGHYPDTPAKSAPGVGAPFTYPIMVLSETYINKTCWYIAFLITGPDSVLRAGISKLRHANSLGTEVCKFWKCSHERSTLLWTHKTPCNEQRVTCVLRYLCLQKLPLVLCTKTTWQIKNALLVKRSSQYRCWSKCAKNISRFICIWICMGLMMSMEIWYFS